MVILLIFMWWRYRNVRRPTLAAVAMSPADAHDAWRERTYQDELYLRMQGRL